MRIKIMLVICILILSVVAVSCESEKGNKNTVDEDEMTFTLEELSKYDGKDGNLAYIAIDGEVYDVTKISQWAGGIHVGYEAGKDQTEVLEKKAPHGVSKLARANKVGKLID